GRQDPHRARSGNVSPPRRAFARADRCPEHRSDEPGRLLPELPLEMVSRRSRGARRPAVGPAIAGDRLWHALRRMAGEISEGGQRRAEGCPRPLPATPESATPPPPPC